MAKAGKKAINIQKASSAEGLKEALQNIARQRAVTTSRIVEKIYKYAVNNEGIFPNSIENPRSKPGKHISSEVSIAVADELMNWAIRLGRSRSQHCCFLLEYVIDNEDSKGKIFD